MALSLVPGSVHPEDAAAHRAARDVGDRPGTIVVTSVIPPERVVDDIDPVRQAVCDGLVEIDLVADLDQRELGAGGDVVDDFRHRGAVRDPAREARAGQVILNDSRGQVAAGLRLREPAEAEVDDGDLDARSGHSSAGVGIGLDRRTSFGQRSKGVRLIRRSDERDTAQLGDQRGELADRDRHLDQRRRRLYRRAGDSERRQGGDVRGAGLAGTRLHDHGHHAGLR